MLMTSASSRLVTTTTKHPCTVGKPSYNTQSIRIRHSYTKHSIYTTGCTATTTTWWHFCVRYESVDITQPIYQICHVMPPNMVYYMEIRATNSPIPHNWVSIHTVRKPLSYCEATLCAIENLAVTTKLHINNLKVWITKQRLATGKMWNILAVSLSVTTLAYQQKQMPSNTHVKNTKMRLLSTFQSNYTTIKVQMPSWSFWMNINLNSL